MENNLIRKRARKKRNTFSEGDCYQFVFLQAVFLFVSQRALVQIDDVLGVGRVVVLRRPEMRRLLKHITHTHTHTHTHTEKKEEEKFVKLNDFLEASPFSLATGSYPPCLPLHPMSPFWPMLAPFWGGGGGGFPGIEMLSHLSTRFESGLAGPREP